MLAILTENLFIDTTDSILLKDSSFFKEIGEAHARGIAKFLGLSEKREEKGVGKMLESGDKGKAVKVVNYQLASLGYISWKDREYDVFGTTTQNALKKFQSDQHIPVTGVYDSVTALQFAKILTIYYESLKESNML